MEQNQVRDLRFPKQFGDFAETLSMYVLGLQNWSVALIDHVGADLLAVDSSKSKRYAISVKGRNFPDSESKSFKFDKNNIQKLSDTAKMLGMEPAVSFVFVDEQEQVKKIRIMMITLSDLISLSLDDEVAYVNQNSGEDIIIKFTQSARTNHLLAIKQSSVIKYSELIFNELNSLI